ncbi:MAG TPA: hypothetical protein VLB76_12170 [Thermoanaerobaculia bacterium]|jgi:archaellum component FlaC|nr:hypothetical protein [Thermoanaerobaculia bacterium]
MPAAAILGEKLKTPAYEDVLKAASGSLAALGDLHLPAALSGLEAMAAQAAATDPTSAGGALGPVLRSIQDLVPTLAAPLAALESLTGPLELLEAATKQKPPVTDQIRTLIDRLEAELKAPGGSGFAGRLARLVAALGAAPEGQALEQLLGTWLQAGGIAPAGGGLLPLGELAAGVPGALEALGGLMSLETVLADGERLAAILAGRLDPAAVDLRLDALLSVLDAAAAAEPAAAVPLLGQARVQLDELGTGVAEEMAFGEATLLYLDLPRLQIEVKRAAATVSAADTEAIARALEALAGRLPGLAGIPLDGIAERGLDELLNDLESRSAELADAIAQADTSLFTAPIQDTVSRLHAVRQQVNAAIAQSAVAARAALEELRDAVAALPVALAADPVRGFVDRVRKAIAEVEHLVAQVKAGIAALAAKAQEAVEAAEAGLATFKMAIKEVFDAADEAVDALHLDTVIGQVEVDVRAFADQLAAFQMKPYVDAAVNGIDKAAGVIEKVPFKLLPASMKAEVDALISSLRSDPERLKAFEPDWEEIQGELEAQVKDLKKSYDGLMAEIAELDPRELAAGLDGTLHDLAAQVREISPRISLEPVAKAVETLRSAVASVDFAKELDDLQTAFDEILLRVDAYSPDALVKPLRERLDAARTRLLAELRIDDWSPALADLARSAEDLLALLDPARAEEEIAAAWDEARRLLATLPELAAAGGFGTLITAFLTGTGLRVHPLAFEVVARWLGGKAGASRSDLGGRTGRLAQAIAKARAAVETIDPQQILARLLPRLEQVRGLAGDAAIQEVQDVAQRALGSLVNNRKRYLAALAAAAGVAEILSHAGFAEAEAGVLRLRGAVDPLRILWRLLLRLLARAGVHGLEEGLTGLLRGVLDAAPPERVARILAPILQAVHARLSAAIEDVRKELDSGIQELKGLIGEISLAPLETALSGLHLEIHAQLAPLSPRALLGDLSQDLQTLQAGVLALDPLQGLEAALAGLRDGAARLLETIDAGDLLDEPIRRWEKIVAAFAGLDIEALLAPVLESLDGLREETDAGFDQAIAAYARLQEALPAA